MRLTKRLLQEIANEHLGMEFHGFHGDNGKTLKDIRGCFLGFRG